MKVIAQEDNMRPKTVAVKATKVRGQISKTDMSNTGKKETYIEIYRHSVLGYRKSRRSNLSMIDMVKRVAIIYDHAVHKKPVK